MNFCIGVDVGGTDIKFGLFDANGTLLEQWKKKTQIGEGLIKDIAEEVTNKVGNNKLLGVGLGVPGPVQDDGFVSACVNLGLRNINFQTELSKFLGDVPIAATNDANAAALGEMWRGAGQGYKNLVMVTLGTGVGGGLVLNGKVLNGLRGVAGEIGHITVNPEEPELCNCGGRGCLEQYSSATGVVTQMKRALAKAQNPEECSLYGREDFTAKDVVDAAKDGDALALETVEYCMEILGKTLTDISQIIDPELYVIGGGLSNAGDFLIDMIAKYYAKHSVFAKAEAEIVQAHLGNNAGIYGAAKLILDSEVREKAIA
ncbi:MAG: ROK family glucokinase [Firmicutes bacterium]|jgi:glucokinase|nr:ROK family glucokinase [Bacillota bacterium]